MIYALYPLNFTKQIKFSYEFLTFISDDRNIPDSEDLNPY